MNSAELAQEKAAVRSFLGDRGFFVEVGANDPTSDWSQTWHLEQCGWKGILIEPLQQWSERLRRDRPLSTVVQAACTSPDKVGHLTLQIPVLAGIAHTELAGTETGIDEPVADRYDLQRVPALTLDQILEQHGGPSPDFVSIDVEGAELDVLQGFDLRRWRPRLLLIEDKWVYFDKHRHLRRHGYKLVKRTGPNSWYVPFQTKFALTGAAERLKMYRKLYLGIWARKIRKALEMRSWRPFRQL